MSKFPLNYGLPPAQGLYHPAQEHDACGVGFVADIQGRKSHSILERAIGCVCQLAHRGALDADAKSGDGAGVLTQIPAKFFRKEVEKLGQRLYSDMDLGVGVFFLPHSDNYAQAHIRRIAEEVVTRRGLQVLGWRPVPVNLRILGEKAAASAPKIEQFLVARPDAKKLSDDAYELILFLARNEIEHRCAADRTPPFYIPSFSSRVIVYKGMLTGTQLPRFYPDLQDPTFETSLAVFHQRYSTNTFPTWPLAHPFRMLAHNGEINTLCGNRNWVRAREADLAAPGMQASDLPLLHPIIQPGGSDSSSLDNAFELLSITGRGPLEAMLMLVPSAFRSEDNLSEDVRGFYEYHECLNEPWDGPAALAFSDGRIVAASLDRNGLRPARYKITKDGLIVMGSEVGIGDLPDKNIAEKGRLSPGEMIAVDTVNKKLLRNDDIKKFAASAKPYGEWVKAGLRSLTSAPSQLPAVPADLNAKLLSFGYSDEELKIILLPMIQKAEEAIGSMGDDAALAVFSRKPRLLYQYFRQLFAQVTNPPIDPIREKLVMSTAVYLGTRPNWLTDGPDHVRLIRLESPVIAPTELPAILGQKEPHLRSKTLSVLFPAAGGSEAFKKRLHELADEAATAVKEGVSILCLSDRGTTTEQAALPMLLAVSSVHHALIRAGLRMRASLIADTGDCRDVHHFACLVSFGASAVCPYLIWELAARWQTEGALPEMDAAKIVSSYRQAVDKGLLKIMSKMGISMLTSYHGSQLFEAVGLGEKLIRNHFTETSSQVGGIGLDELADETIRRHQEGYAAAVSAERLPDAGLYRWRRDGEMHSITPPAIQALHSFVGLKGADQRNQPAQYRAYVDALSKNTPVTIRHLLRLRQGRTPIPIDEVEPIEDIRRRFTTAGMSLGALSPEAHEALAIAMNRIGGKSNSGEGGEDRARFSTMENGDSKNSRIKQVASGRFGVTAEYLASATELEIKIAQGAKPGEGGQLPGHKVSPLIATLRRSTPGVMLISPPPHHDIYSIEDLAQLIYDLKQVNPRAKVCVKLVAEAGVGTIAAGVAKAHADVILVAGHDGGTGASPLSSIKYAGSPWELGVAETQQVLLLNGLRNRITLRTDGGIRTGIDIVIAALLGAEEFNFGTTALIALGCVFVRQCHLNNCPTGVATQDDKFRAKFRGTPEAVVDFFNAVAQDVREILASLGVRKLDEIIGHPEFLETFVPNEHPKAATVDLKPLLNVPDIDPLAPRHHTWERNDKLEDQPLDARILQDSKDALQKKRKIKLSYKIQNVHRSVGAQLSGEIAYRYGDEGLADGTIQIKLDGSSGQSFGAFLVQGVKLTLQGEANDYVGKSMSGGEIVLLPPKGVSFDPSLNSICGNTCLYGATGGKLFAYGRAGERFAVRNSGATAVIEGVGDHGCEYMTRGTVVVLGPTGKNFGAGMSGGLAYVLDEDGRFEKRYNPGMVTLEKLSGAEDAKALQAIIYQHLEATESKKAKEILAKWDEYAPKFRKVVPHPPVSTLPASQSTVTPAAAKC
ncbi:MAG: glutamate synthase large subunit [Verrucomicrobia bacterium]|nr:glutamate synthase large subunit [Verrucomicrobiota bacterium]